MVKFLSNIHQDQVLNLIITGIPSIQSENTSDVVKDVQVLNLIITGIPSILSQLTDNSVIDTF